MQRVNFGSTYLHSHGKMKLNYLKTCKNEIKLSCKEKRVPIAYNM